jgi:hypothetical protein
LSTPQGLPPVVSCPRRAAIYLTVMAVPKTAGQRRHEPCKEPVQFHVGLRAFLIAIRDCHT